MELSSSLGYLQDPVLVAGHWTWTGYRPGKIAALAHLRRVRTGERAVCLDLPDADPISRGTRGPRPAPRTGPPPRRRRRDTARAERALARLVGSCIHDVELADAHHGRDLVALLAAAGRDLRAALAILRTLPDRTLTQRAPMTRPPVPDTAPENPLGAGPVNPPSDHDDNPSENDERGEREQPKEADPAAGPRGFQALDELQLHQP